MGYDSSPTLHGDLEEDKGNKGYASQKGLRHKSLFESEDKGYSLVRQPSLPIPIMIPPQAVPSEVESGFESEDFGDRWMNQPNRSCLNSNSLW